jgi:hypothetical protein
MRNNELYILIAVVLVLLLTTISFIYAKQLSIFFKTLMGTTVKDQVKEKCPNLKRLESLTEDQMYSVLLNTCPQDCVFTTGEWSPCSSTTCGTSGTQTRNPTITKKPDDLGLPCPASETRACFNPMCNDSVTGKCFATFGTTINFKDSTRVTVDDNTYTYVKSGNLITINIKGFTWDGTTLKDITAPNSVIVLEPCAQTSTGTGLAGKCFLNGDLLFRQDTLLINNSVLLKYRVSGTDVFVELMSFIYDGTNLKYYNEIIQPCATFSNKVYKSNDGTTLRFMDGKNVHVNSVPTTYTFNKYLYQINIDGTNILVLYLQSSGNIVTSDNMKIFTVSPI